NKRKGEPQMNANERRWEGRRWGGGLRVACCWFGRYRKVNGISNGEFQMPTGGIGRWMKVVEGGCSWMKVKKIEWEMQIIRLSDFQIIRSHPGGSNGG